MEVQCLAGCILADWWEASQGLSCKLLMTVVVAMSSLKMGSRDSPWGRGEACWLKWVAPLVGELCCTAMLEPWAAAAGGLDSSY